MAARLIEMGFRGLLNGIGALIIKNTLERGALIRKGTLIGRRELNRIITVLESILKGRHNVTSVSTNVTIIVVSDMYLLLLSVVSPSAVYFFRVDCLKIHEVPRTPTPWVICGSGIKTTVEHLCGLRVKREGIYSKAFYV